MYCGQMNFFHLFIDPQHMLSMPIFDATLSRQTNLVIANEKFSKEIVDETDINNIQYDAQE